MKLTPALRRLVWGTVTAVYLTGMVVWALNPPSPGDLPDPGRVLWLQSHSVISLWFIGLFGYLMHAHVIVSWRRKQKRKSGATLTAVFLGLMLTVPPLFYATNELVRDAAAWIHTYLGIMTAAPFLLHYFLPKRD